MLIDLSHLGPVTIYPDEYVKTLAIRLDVPPEREGFPARSGFGVFKGRHESFEDGEEGQAVPPEEDDGFGSHTYLIKRPYIEPRRFILNRWEYAVVGYADEIFSGFPYAYKLRLQESCGEEGITWSVNITAATEVKGFEVVLPDYEPIRS